MQLSTVVLTAPYKTGTPSRLPEALDERRPPQRTQIDDSYNCPAARVPTTVILSYSSRFLRRSFALCTRYDSARKCRNRWGIHVCGYTILTLRKDWCLIAEEPPRPSRVICAIAPTLSCQHGPEPRKTHACFTGGRFPLLLLKTVTTLTSVLLDRLYI